MTAMDSPEQGRSLWICPHCNAPLSEFVGGLQCSNGHSYDRARQGYVNLLLANQKNSKSPGDSGDMLSARRTFFESGIYDSLFASVSKTVLSHYPQSSPEPCILDIGCGEGSYLRRIANELQAREHLSEVGIHICGIDISKFAVKQAASLVKQGEFAVASSYALPLSGDSVDIALNVFAPISVDEVLRVLKPEAVLVRVSPAQDHLQQVKEKIYPQLRTHDEPQALEGFELLEKHLVSFKRELSEEALKLLLAMTPLSWRGDQTAKEKLISSGAKLVDFDFIVEVLRPRSLNV